MNFIPSPYQQSSKTRQKETPGVKAQASNIAVRRVYLESTAFDSVNQTLKGYVTHVSCEGFNELGVENLSNSK